MSAKRLVTPQGLCVYDIKTLYAIATTCTIFYGWQPLSDIGLMELSQVKYSSSKLCNTIGDS